MHILAVVIGIVLLYAAPLFAREKTDVLVMKNGDRITCEVKGLDGGVLYVSLDYVDGTVYVDWSKVARLESRQIFLVRTRDGSIYKGTLNSRQAAVGLPVTIQIIESPERQVELESPQIVTMLATSDTFWKRFSGEVSFGTIYSKGNQSTQYTLGAQTAYVRERWSAQASFDSTLSSSAGVNASTRNSLTLGARHLLPRNNWFYSGLGTFLQSSEQGITLQSTLGVGIGRYLKNTNRARISVLCGGAWQNTNYHQALVPLGKENLAAALVYADARLFRFSKSNLDVTAALLPAISDPGRVRFNTNATYYIKLISNLKWNLSFYGNWDSRPPAGLSGSDYGSSSGVSWTFGLK